MKVGHLKFERDKMKFDLNFKSIDVIKPRINNSSHSQVLNKKNNASFIVGLDKNQASKSIIN